ncbi:MAG: hypothetical protein ACKO11_03865 [Cuspidothrix sp.]
MPPVISWNIKKSKELISKSLSLSEEIRNGLEEFIIKAESGENLKPHISTRINDPDYKDLMSYDWGFFHFHLGTNPHPTQTEFIKRTNELLFAITVSQSAMMYLIDIYPHEGGCTNQDLLRIIEENWGELLDPHTVLGIDEIDYNPSDNDIRIFRKTGFVTMLKTPGGRILSPIGGGITTDGTSVQNREDVDNIITRVRELENWFIQQRNILANEFKNKYNKEWDDLHFKVISFEKPAEIKELTTGDIRFVSS